ncbi:MAG: glycosyltransferase, partial [Terriglobales bacterium]
MFLPFIHAPYGRCTIKILVLSSFLPPSVGGTENVAAVGIEALRDRGHDVTAMTGTVVTPPTSVHDPPPAGQPLLVRIRSLHPLENDAQCADQLATELGALLSAHDYDVMYAHLLTYPWAPRRSTAIIRTARAHGLPVIAAEHLDAPKHRSDACVDLMLAVSVVVCCSRYVRDRLLQLVRETHPTGTPPLFEISYPRVVSGTIFFPDHRARNNMRRELGLQPTDFVVFFPSRFFDANGSLSAHKQPLLALKAFREFARLARHAKLVTICQRGHG